MSTTRPLLGMKRVTEVTCKEPLGNRLSPTGSKQQQESLTVDEFAVFENKQEELKCAKPRVEQVFRVVFTIIGLLDTGAHSSTASRQIWLQLKGKRDDVSRAKEYLKGLCDPELQQEEHYPVDMHCIFAGARGLFLDRLLRDTSAEVVMLEPGTLRLLGCFESVIMAKSRVQQFVALFQEKRSLPGDREPAVKRTFKTFVEERDDKYAMELLLLPSALKEELLGLAQSPTQPFGSSTPVTDLSNRILDTSFEEKAVGAASGAETGLLNGDTFLLLETAQTHWLAVKPGWQSRWIFHRGPGWTTCPGEGLRPWVRYVWRPAPPPLTATTRFHDSLRNPYTLTLQNEPGHPDLRHIIIDGSNVAMAHGLHRFFSCRGIAIAVEAFWRQGHREITVFVPQWRQKRDRYTTEQHYLNQLEDLRLLSFTPSREVCGQRISSHDDRFLLHLAEKTGGVIVTNDNLRDFVNTSEAWMRIIQERLLQFTFVEDHFMIPDDPLGKHGPHLEVFLRKDNSPVTPPLRPDPRATPQPVFVQALQSAPRPSFRSHPPHPSPPLQRSNTPRPTPSPPPQRSPSETIELKRKLYDIFPDQKQRIDRILSDNPYMRDLNALSGLLLG
ncbi:unnamed protein product [Oncorhynchus mykiss]|uniref:NEDD4-binding protein 1 n=1 Tax=Oncorhynchus mykiss TaxID=8022 RepID=A0A060X8Q5_ONCMY|nr:unnamed protein product [Oncorhynchus mykiss]